VCAAARRRVGRAALSIASSCGRPFVAEISQKCPKTALTKPTKPPLTWFCQFRQFGLRAFAYFFFGAKGCKPTSHRSALPRDARVPDVTDGRPPAGGGRNRKSFPAGASGDKQFDRSRDSVSIGEAGPSPALNVASCEGLRQLSPALDNEARAVFGHDASSGIKPGGMRP
jgi:hypothetical protein